MDDENGEGEERNNDEKQDGEDNSKGNNEQERQVTNFGAKKGDKNEEYDEKALMMDRKYREIPEDVGGLLREFIKKEYIKDRYKNENN